MGGDVCPTVTLVNSVGIGLIAIIALCVAQVRVIGQTRDIDQPLLRLECKRISDPVVGITRIFSLFHKKIDQGLVVAMVNPANSVKLSGEVFLGAKYKGRK